MFIWVALSNIFVLSTNPIQSLYIHHSDVHTFNITRKSLLLDRTIEELIATFEALNVIPVNTKLNQQGDCLFLYRVISQVLRHIVLIYGHHNGLSLYSQDKNCHLYLQPLFIKLFYPVYELTVLYCFVFIIVILEVLY